VGRRALPRVAGPFWQNLRRAEGWNIQYFGAVEPQRRLAPHAHFAARGSFPREILRAVTAATYHQVWWPPTDLVVYREDDDQPMWNLTAGPTGAGGYVDPGTGLPLPTWVEAMDALDDALDADPDREPEHVVQFGVQVDARGVLGGAAQADKLIGYTTKYLTKSVTECHKPRNAGGGRTPTPAMGAAANHALLAPVCELAALRHPTQRRPGKDAGRSVQGQGAPARHVGHRRPPRSRLPRLVGQNPGRPSLGSGRLGAQSPRHRTRPTDPRYQTHDEQIAAARAGQAPDPIRWERARPNDPDIPELPSRLLRAIATRIKQKAALRAAMALAPPGPDVSATSVGSGEGRAA
jgi:hypothetical protein